MDTPDERYEKTIDTAKDLFILQYGISIFRRAENKFTTNTYNFYLSPTSPVMVWNSGFKGI